MTRPRRQRRHDRLTHPHTASPKVTAIDQALAPLDRLARHYDRVWGIDRLPELVSPELAARYGSALGKLNAAIDAEDPDEVVRHVGAVMRGLDKLNEEAEARGAEKPDGNVIEVKNEDVHFGILTDAEEWKTAQERNPHIPRFVTLREIANAIAAYDKTVTHPVVKSVMDAFPNAKLKIKEPENVDDEIPF